MIAAQGGLPTLEWAILIVGGIITVAFNYSFKLDDFRLQLLIAAMLSALIALKLYLAPMFASPSSVDVKIDPDISDAPRRVMEDLPEK